MNAEDIIIVKDVKKNFRVYYDKGSSLKEKVLFRNRNRYENRSILNGISFNIKKGEAVGLIGHNGCGKSTTLKLLTKIIYPDEGIISISGRVSSLIELGAGFHPDMSGRENIYTNASILGLTSKEIDERIDDIIRFSELEDYMDNPVRTYSSGMYMRLAFSVAINVDADILLIDEILAVGDANFQAKCLNKLREIKSKGTTIVIVSHSLAQIEQICDRTLWIHEGNVRCDGNPHDIHPIYMDHMGKKRQSNILEIQKVQEVKKKTISNVNNNIRWGNGKARIEDIKLYNVNGDLQNVFRTGSDLIIKINYSVNHKVEDAVFGIGIFRSDGIQCFGTNTRIDNLSKYDLISDGICEIQLKQVNLIPGIYNIDIAIECNIGDPVDYYKNACQIQTYSTINDVGIVRLEHTWTIV